MNAGDEKLKQARKAVDRLRDHARAHGMGTAERDNLVMTIHDALDVVEFIQSHPSKAGIKSAWKAVTPKGKLVAEFWDAFSFLAKHKP